MPDGGSWLHADSLQQEKRVPRLSACRRFFDIAFSLATAPLWCAIGVLAIAAVKTERCVRGLPRKRVLFVQKRLGYGETKIRVYKIRTLWTVRMPQGGTSRYRGKKVPLLVGRPLRWLHIDEVFQFLDIIRGDLSLIGPRPVPSRVYRSHMQLLGCRYRGRYEAVPGLTGLGQFHRRKTSPQQALERDLGYLMLRKHCSRIEVVGMDFLILCATAIEIILFRGE